MMERVLDPLRRRKRALLERRALPDPHWRARCVERAVPLEEVRLDGQGGLCLTRLDLVLTRCEVALELLGGYPLMLELAALREGALRWDGALQCLRVSQGGTRYDARCVEELWILREVLMAGDYDLIVPGPCVVLDVGANVGFTSIYLAALGDDVQVVGFEPLPANFERAVCNVAVNPGLAPRIELRQHALARCDATRDLYSIERHRGRSSLVAPPTAPQPGLAVERHPVSCVRASQVVRSVQRQYPGRRLLMKLDCEGSEFEILDELHDAGILRLPDAYLLEWHDVAGGRERVERLRTMLCESGFHVHARGRHGVPGAGMLLATAARD